MHTPRRHALILGLAATLLAPIMVVGGTAGPSSAHDYAISSTPDDGAVLDRIPAEFDLTMNEDLLDLAGAGNGFALQIIGADGRYYGDGCVTIAGPRMSTPAALGAPGDYRMLWQIVSADGHAVSDEYDFTWAPSAETDADTGPDSESAPGIEPGIEPATGSETPPVCGVPSEPTESASPTRTPAPSEPGDSVSGEPIPDASAPSTDPLTPALLIGGAILAAAAVVAAGFIAVTRRSRRP